MGTFLHDDVADFLSSGGVTTTIYRGFMPPSPDEALQVVGTGGVGAVHAFSSSAGTAIEERPSVQILRRSLTIQRATAEMNVIWKLLDGMGDRTINGTRYFWVEALHAPFPIGVDASNRHLVVCNFRVCKALSTSTST